MANREATTFGKSDRPRKKKKQELVEKVVAAAVGAKSVGKNGSKGR